VTKWQYNVVGGLNGFSQISEVFDAMNRLGAEGWELVDMDHDRGWAWFKRPIQAALLDLCSQNEMCMGGCGLTKKMQGAADTEESAG